MFMTRNQGGAKTIYAVLRETEFHWIARRARLANSWKNPDRRKVTSVTELQTSTTDLIQWRYAWYVAAAFGIMIAAITSNYLWPLNFVHVFTSLLWTGIDLFMGFV